MALVPRGFSTVPALQASDVWQLLGGAGRLELVVDMDPLVGPRLSYRVFRVVERDPPEVERVFVDARTGRVYRREPMVWHAAPKGKVFLENPVETPGLEEVVLPHLAPSEENPILASDDVVALSCMAPSECRQDPQGGTYSYSCNFDFNAKADEDGNFFYDFETDTAGEDCLAEVSAYYHLTRAFDGVRALTGMEQVVNNGIVAIANYRESASPDVCEEEKFVGPKGLTPYDNAAFVPGGFGLFDFPHNAVLIGQGTNIDYAYDGDVLIHEFGHGYHHTVAPELSRGFLDERGLNPTPGGLMEGYADLVTLALTNDPEIGEYAGGDKPIRVLDNGARCPEHLTGEMHIDSEIFTGAVFEARTLVATTALLRKKFDASLLSSAAGLGAYDGFESAAKAVLKELAVTMGPEPAGMVEAVFAERGLFGCGGRVVPAEPKQFLWMTGYFSDGETPGPLQFKYDLQEAASKIGAVAGYVAPQIGPGELVAVLKKGAPIAWGEEDGKLVGDYEMEAEFLAVPDSDERLALFEGVFSPGQYHIMFVHRGQGSDVVAGIQFGHAGPNVANPTPVSVLLPAEQMPAEQLPAEQLPAEQGGGCQGAPIGAAWWLFAPLFFICRRRAA